MANKNEITPSIDYNESMLMVWAVGEYVCANRNGTDAIGAFINRLE